LANCGVAPANALEEVRNIADIVAVNNDEDLLHDIVFHVLPGLL
jgi:hydroxymethylpyrimidine pyrophosphatase-like HAD family hydrolase